MTTAICPHGHQSGKLEIVFAGLDAIQGVGPVVQAPGGAPGVHRRLAVPSLPVARCVEFRLQCSDCESLYGGPGFWLVTLPDMDSVRFHLGTAYKMIARWYATEAE